MNSQGNLRHSVKMYWQEEPPDEEQLKNVLPSSIYCQPSELLNSYHAHAEPKPWLQKGRVKKKESKASFQKRVILTNQNIQDTKNINLEQKFDPKENIKEKHFRDIPSSCSQSSSCSLSELRKEDKQRVADLIREMAKYNEEKENAMKELANLKCNFDSKLKALETERENMISEQDNLKERLLEYEVLISEMKNKHIDNRKEREKVENVSEVKEEDMLMRSAKRFSSRREEKAIDEFTSMFLAQQEKFQQQQEILQRQIEELHTLQEAILEEKNVKEAILKDEQKSREELHAFNKNIFQSEKKSESSLKLQNYISQQATSKPLNILEGYQNNKGEDDSVDVLVSDTLIHEDRENSVVDLHSKSSKLSKITKPSEPSSKISGDLSRQKDSVSKKTGDVCIQTDDLTTENVLPSNSKSKEAVSYQLNRLELCEKNISRLEHSLNHVSSINPTNQKSSIINGNNKNTRTLKPDRIIATNDGNSDDDMDDLGKMSKTDRLDAILDINSDDDIDDLIIGKGRKSTSLLSALQRGHYQPSSILDFIDGLQPPSTSTSIDHHHSVHKCSHRKPLSPTNHHMKSKAKHERAVKMQRAYGAHKKMQGLTRTKNAERSNEDQEEQKMLSDVFFIR